MNEERDDRHLSIHATHPVVGDELTFGSVTDKISAIVLKRKTPIGWFIGFAISFAIFQLLLLTITNLLFNGIGLWGINQPVGWGFAIINFVWWIGIGHAGTLISAILLLLRQKWRTSINRFAEAMTLFAVAQAGIFPVMHLGRLWFAYWLFAFSITIVPGWHATIFPPYFVAGAIYAGFAMVLLLTIPLRKVYGLESFITMRHMHNMAKVMLATGLIVAYGYVMEAFFGWYSGNGYEHFMVWNRMHGPYAPYYWTLILCNGITPQLLRIKKVRANLLALWLISLVVSVGMWLERFVIVVTSLHRDFLPSSWGFYKPTQWDWAMFIGTIGFFLALVFLFIRFLPMISIFEMRTILPAAEVEE